LVSQRPVKGSTVAHEYEPGHALPVTEHWADRVATVTVGGDVDMLTVGRLRACLAAVVDKHPERLIVDLAAVGFLDTSAIHAFVQARHALPPECPVVLRSPQQIVRRVFELTGLDQTFVIE
jgi:stage II sporulation protein AA (anti-sigma F factor antagonist)